MPLIPGTGRKTLSQNIEELMNSYHAKGSIGTSAPKNPVAARKQAIAIAYSKQKESK